MRIAIFSDVHGNLPALERFVQNTRQRADAYLCLGDIVNYGPWNDECLELAASLPGFVFLEGNHERLFLGLDPIEEELPLVQDFFHRSFSNFTRKDLIANLPAEHRLGEYVCTHTISGRKVYKDTAIEVDRSYIIGHNHQQYLVERNGWTIASCGSIGQNRACVDLMNYAFYDTEAGTIELCEEPSPFDRFLSELHARGYSERCIEYYTRKRRGATS